MTEEKGAMVPPAAEGGAVSQASSPTQSNMSSHPEPPASAPSLSPEQVAALLRTARANSGAFAPPSPSSRPEAATRRNLRGPARLLVVALGLGGMADALFWEQQPGIGVPLFALLALLALLGLSWNEGVRAGGGGRRCGIAPLLLAPALLFFTGMIAVRDNTLLVFLDTVSALCLAGLLAHLYAGGELTTLGIAGFLSLPWLSAGNACIGAARPLQAISQGAAVNDSERRQRTLAVVRGLLIAVPLLAVLVPLLLAADAVFAHAADRLTAWLFPSDWADRLGHLLLIGTVAWLTAGGLVYALTRVERQGDPATATVPPKRPLGFVEGMTPLVLVCALFAAFVAIQFAYLFGGSARVLALPGLTYAAYARRGFGELSVVAALTLGIATLWQRLLHRETAAQETAFRCVSTLLAGLTLVMLVSANQRMAAYEAAYGATVMRLYVDAFLVCLGLVLTWFALTLWAGWERRFAFGAFAIGLGCLAWLNLENPDAIVARTNIARALAGQQPLDSSLYSLSDDAVPALCAALDRLTGDDRRQVADLLKSRRIQRQCERQQIGWPSWNASRAAAWRVLAAQPAIAPSSPAEADPCRCDE